MKRSEISSFGLHVLDSELKKKKELVDSFTYNCSHSIRSPLKSMEGIVKLLREYPDDISADGIDYYSLLRNSAARLQAIVFQFDELRRNSEKPLCLKPVDFARMLDRIIAPFHSRVKELAINIKTHTNQKGDFTSDVSRIETIVSELVSNAINFRDPDKREHQISIYITSSPASCSIQVHDNGVGISNNDLRKIFSLFYRGTEISGGSGLGLFVARQITEKLKGTLTAQSAVKSHTVFSLWIPSQMR